MKYCTNCGCMVKDGALFCSECGKAVDKVVPNNNVSVNNTNKTDGFAITGFVLSLVSIFLCGTTSLLGLIFSIVGAVRCSKQRFGGKGLAIAGIIISSVLFFLLLVLYFCGIFAYLVNSNTYAARSSYPYY